MFGAWRNFQGGAQEGAPAPESSNVEVAGAAVDQNQVTVDRAADQRALTVPTGPDGASESIYGPHHRINTGEELGQIIADQDVATYPDAVEAPPADYGDVDIRMRKDANGLLTADLGDSADADQAEDADAETDPEDQSAEGPLPQLQQDGRALVWSRGEQQSAEWWQGRIAQRVTAHMSEILREHGVSEDGFASTLANDLVERVTTGLLGDYAQLTFAKAQEALYAAQQVRAAWEAELGGSAEVDHQLNLIDAHLKDATFFPDGVGEAIIEARVGTVKLINIPGIAQYFAKQARRSGHHISEERADEDKERKEIIALRNTNIDAYYGERRFGPNGDMTGEQRIYQIDKKRELAAA